MKSTVTKPKLPHNSPGRPMPAMGQMDLNRQALHAQNAAKMADFDKQIPTAIRRTSKGKSPIPGC